MRDGKSSLLYELADRIGNVVKEEESGSGVVSGNVVAMTRIGQEIDDAFLMSNATTFVVKKDEDLIEIDDGVEVIHVMDGVCNDSDIEEWNLNDCSSELRELVLGDDCLQYVSELKLVGLICLEKMEMGAGCYSESEGGAFEMSKCDKLRSVVIGGGCCVKWSSFTLKNCDSIQEVSIGDGCFVNCENTVFESECCLKQ